MCNNSSSFLVSHYPTDGGAFRKYPGLPPLLFVLRSLEVLSHDHITKENKLLIKFLEENTFKI